MAGVAAAADVGDAAGAAGVTAAIARVGVDEVDCDDDAERLDAVAAGSGAAVPASLADRDAPLLARCAARILALAATLAWIFAFIADVAWTLACADGVPLFFAGAGAASATTGAGGAASTVGGAASSICPGGTRPPASAPAPSFFGGFVPACFGALCVPACFGALCVPACFGALCFVPPCLETPGFGFAVAIGAMPYGATVATSIASARNTPEDRLRECLPPTTHGRCDPTTS